MEMDSTFVEVLVSTIEKECCLDHKSVQEDTYIRMDIV